jgi:hypothetical protein
VSEFLQHDAQRSRLGELRVIALCPLDLHYDFLFN